MMTFHGVKSPALDIPLIELETPQGDLVDLYNDYHLQSVVLRGDQLTFGFASVTAGTPTDVRFSGVRICTCCKLGLGAPRGRSNRSSPNPPKRAAAPSPLRQAVCGTNSTAQ